MGRAAAIGHRAAPGQYCHRREAVTGWRRYEMLAFERAETPSSATKLQALTSIALNTGARFAAEG